MNKEYLEKKNLLDQTLGDMIADSIPEGNPLKEMMAYSISSSGKRIRGVLTLVFCDRLGVPTAQAMPFALALEMIHAYSLVHDDMPEMDNDALRRGLPTCHKKFGADMALLTGDAILNFCAEMLLSKRKLYQPDNFMGAFEMLFAAAGAQGMLLGQVLDKKAENCVLSMDELLLLHSKKTGELLLAPIKIAECLSGKTNENYVNYCTRIGLAFQIKDDLLDVEGATDVLGKEIGSDADECKSTFVSLLGVSRAHEYLNNELAAAAENACGDAFLLWLAKYIGNREK